MPPEDENVERTDTSLDGLTPGERAYMESGGENADALRAEDTATAAAPAEPKPAEKPVAEPEKKEPAAADAKPADAPAPKDPPADDEDEGETTLAADGKTKAIPYQKYQRETKKLRDRLAALEKDKQELADKFVRGDERSKMLAELVQQTAEPAEAKPDPAVEDPEPDPNVDLIAWANWSRRDKDRMRQEMVQTREAVSQTRETFAESTADQKAREDYQADAMAFAKDTPDFGPAYNHLLTVRAAMLQEQGHSEKEIRTILRNEEKGLVQRAFQQNKRPAELIYNMSKRLGWTTPAPAPAPAAVAPPAVAAPAAPAKPSVVEEIERIQKGQDANKSLSGVGGSAQELSVESLANMNEQEFAALYAKMGGKIDELLGQRAH